MSAQDFYKQFFIKLKKEVKNVLYQNMEFYILNWVRPILSLATTWPHWPGSQASQQKTREGGSRRAQNIAEITTSSSAAEDIILLNSEHLQHHHSIKMLCEDQLMSVDNTPQKGSGSLNSSASSISIDVKPQMQSWAQEVRAEFGHSDEASSSFNSSAASCGSLVKKEPADIKLEPADVKLEPAEVSADREMAFEFLDGVNEEKFERLVKEEKLKTPYKRRHSQTPPTNENSRSNSPNSSSNSSANGDVTAATRNRSGNNSRQRQSNFRSHKEEKRLRHNSYTSSTSSSSSYTEADPAVLARRQKQIDYGKNTAAYERYAEMVPKAERGREHPRTPNKYGKYSRRAFDGLVKIWRKSLHVYDPPTQPGGGEGNNNSDSDSD